MWSQVQTKPYRPYRNGLTLPFVTQPISHVQTYYNAVDLNWSSRKAVYTGIHKKYYKIKFTDPNATHSPTH